ncbi:MAG: NYN domain-containing protein [Anaerolineaceae bacterium]
MSERVTFFIDGTNLYFGLIKDLQRLDLDFQKLVLKLLNGRTLSRVYYYAVAPTEEQAILETEIERFRRQMKFLEALRRIPYFEVILGRLVFHNGTYIEKGVDIAIAVDMLDLQSTYETAVLISGDSDFCRVVQVVKRGGKHVENATTRTLSSRELQQSCDVFHLLDDEYLKDCWRYKISGFLNQ